MFIPDLEAMVIDAKRILGQADKAKVTAWEYTLVQLPSVVETGGSRSYGYLASGMLAEMLQLIKELPEDKRMWSDCFYSPRAQSMIKWLTLRGIDTESACGQITVIFHLAINNLTGKHKYVVSEGLATLLALTELRGLKADDLKLPFASVHIEAPPHLDLLVSNRELGSHPLAEVYVHEDLHDNATEPGEIVSGRSWRVLMLSKPFRHHRLDAYDIVQSFFSLPLVPGDSIDTALARMKMRASMNPNYTEDDYAKWIATWHWLMNVLVYATTPDADAQHVRGNPEAEAIWRRVQKLPPSSKREDLQTKLRSMDHKWRTILGKKTLLTPALREMYEHRYRKGMESKSVVRTLVAGHWQRYATGAGRTERTWKFRQPFWRGPEDGLVAEHTEHRLTD